MLLLLLLLLLRVPGKMGELIEFISNTFCDYKMDSSSLEWVRFVSGSSVQAGAVGSGGATGSVSFVRRNYVQRSYMCTIYNEDEDMCMCVSLSLLMCIDLTAHRAYD